MNTKGFTFYLIIHATIMICFYVLFTVATAQAQAPETELVQFFDQLEQGHHQHTPSSRCEMTNMTMKARLQWNKLNARAQSVITPWVTRPTDAAGAGAYQNNVSTLDSAHFRIHYIDQTVFPKDEDAASFMVVKQVMVALEKTWQVEHNTLGYALPPSDETIQNNGGNGLYDVYLKNVGSLGLLGFTTTNTVGTNDPSRPNGTYSYIIMDNDFSYQEYGYLDPSILIKVTAAHEYFHAIQFGYDPNEQVALAEQSSTWVEDKVYPNLHDNYHYIGETYVDENGNGQFDANEPFTDRNLDGKRDGGSQNSPERALDVVDSQGDIQYGRFLWLRYLSEQFGDQIIRDIWEQAGMIAGNNGFEATNNALLARGSSLQKAYQEYAVWAYRVENFLYGANYPRAWVEKTFMSEVMNVTSSALPSLQQQQSQAHLSSVYIQVYRPSGEYFLSSYGGLAALSVVLEHSNGSMSIEDVMVNANQATWTAPDSCVRAVFVVSNVSDINDRMVWTLNSSLTGATSVAPVSRKNVVIAEPVATVNTNATLNEGILATKADLTAAKKEAGCFLPNQKPTWAGVWLIPVLLMGFISLVRKRQESTI